MASLALVLGAVALLASPAQAITYNYSATVSNTAQFGSEICVMCNTTFDRANGTGIFGFTPGAAVGSASSQPNNTAFASEVKWALAGAQNTVVGSRSYGLQASLMFSTGKNDFFDSAKLGFDMCAIALDPAFININTYLRAQSDNGSCLQTFDGNCKAAILNLANSATKTINQPSKQGSSSLPGVCTQIASAITNKFPKECLPFSNGMPQQYVTGVTPLTQPKGNDISNLAAACTGTDYNGQSYYNILTLLTSGYSDAAYTLMTTIPWPILTISMPLTDGAATTSIIKDSYSDLTCLHLNRINYGSKAAPVLGAAGPVDYSVLNSTDSSNSTSSTNATTSATASATPIPASSGISGGAIAGIVIGVLAAFALFAAAAFFLYRRRQRQTKGTELTELDGQGTYYADEKRKTSVFSEAHGEAVHEMSPESRKTSELPSPNQPRHELPGYVQKYEMDSGRPPVELPGCLPSDKEKKPDMYG